MMGVARIDLEARDVDFYTLGPSESIQFRMAPGGEKAYGLYSSVGRYEFLTFDLWVMLGASLLLAPFVFSKTMNMTRISGLTLFALYLLYLYLVVHG